MFEAHYYQAYIPWLQYSNSLSLMNKLEVIKQTYLYFGILNRLQSKSTNIHVTDLPQNLLSKIKILKSNHQTRVH